MNEIELTELRIQGHREALAKFTEKLASATREDDYYFGGIQRGAKHWRFAIESTNYRLKVEQARLKLLKLENSPEIEQARLELESIER